MIKLLASDGPRKYMREIFETPAQKQRQDGAVAEICIFRFAAASLVI
jgi:hypothetical protein